MPTAIDRLVDLGWMQVGAGVVETGRSARAVGRHAAWRGRCVRATSLLAVANVENFARVPDLTDRVRTLTALVGHRFDCTKRRKLTGSGQRFEPSLKMFCNVCTSSTSCAYSWCAQTSTRKQTQ